jgi:hypothetical protein
VRITECNRQIFGPVSPVDGKSGTHFRMFLTCLLPEAPEEGQFSHHIDRSRVALPLYCTHIKKKRGASPEAPLSPRKPVNRGKLWSLCYFFRWSWATFTKKVWLAPVRPAEFLA